MEPTRLRRGQWHRAKARRDNGELKHKPPDPPQDPSPGNPPPSPSLVPGEHATRVFAGIPGAPATQPQFGPKPTRLGPRLEIDDDTCTTTGPKPARQTRPAGIPLPLWVILKLLDWTLCSIINITYSICSARIKTTTILRGCGVWAILFGAWPMLVLVRPGSTGKLDDPQIYKFCDFIAPNACDELNDNVYWTFPLLTWGNLRTVSEAYDVGTSLVHQIDAQISAISDARARYDQAAAARRAYVLQWVTSTPNWVFNVTRVIADQASTKVHDFGNDLTARLSTLTSGLITLTYAGHVVAVDTTKFYLEFGVNFTVGSLQDFQGRFRELYTEYDVYLTESALPKHQGRMAMTLATADKRFSGLYLSYILMGFDHQDLADRMALRVKVGGRMRTMMPQLTALEIPVRALVLAGYDPGGIAKSGGFKWDPGLEIS